MQLKGRGKSVRRATIDNATMALFATDATPPAPAPTAPAPTAPANRTVVSTPLVPANVSLTATPATPAANAPLAERMRPRRLEEVIGQQHLLGPNGVWAKAMRADRLSSLILWGPPGTGKTTLAQAVAQQSRCRFMSLSAVLSGLPELRKLLQEAQQRQQRGERTLLFIDEIHRWSRAQQDVLLPFVERGTVVLIGATTENPSFALTAALLSRARVLRLEALSLDDLVHLLELALADTERGLGSRKLRAEPATLRYLAQAADGDARRALNSLEVAAEAAESGVVALVDVEQALAQQALRYDRSGEEHYNLSSAFIKSMRGNDPDAAVYWMMRMLEAGEEPLFLLRRMLIFASEDIGNADPQALQVAVAADQAFQRLGMPEGTYVLSQCCLYLASTVKSNAAYRAWTAAQRDVQQHGSLPVPMHLRNAVTAAMSAWGYGAGYRYPHDEAGHAAGVDYLPELLQQKRYYEPLDVGFEAELRRRLEGLRGTR